MIRLGAFIAYGISIRKAFGRNIEELTETFVVFIIVYLWMAWPMLVDHGQRPFTLQRPTITRHPCFVDSTRTFAE